MKTRLTALLAVSAIVAAVALPTVASAATTRDYASRTASTSYPTVVIPPDGDTTAILVNTEHNYLAGACPTVLAHPGNYSAVLNQFCREFRG